jgi:iron complex transport system substrate-binding protein
VRARRRTALLAAFTALLALTGCAATEPPAVSATPIAIDTAPLAELDVVADPRAYVGESTATMPDAAIEPVAADPAQSLPASVVSHDRGGEVDVRVTDTSRVVAMDLAGSIAATVWGLGFGDTLVGVDQAATFPGTADIPVVTSGGHTVNAESVIALAPTLVLTDGSVGPRDVVEQLRDVGIAVVFVENDASFDGAAQLARDVAAVYGAPDAGELLAERVMTDVQAKIAEIAGIAPSADGERLRMMFLYLRGSAGVYYLFGEESGADQLIEGLGGIDVAGELGWDGMKPMTDEAMVAADPDLVLVMTHGIESVGGVDGLLADKPAIALTKAGEHRRFVDMDDGQILSFGPRSALVLDALARAIYAPGSGS